MNHTAARPGGEVAMSTSAGGASTHAPKIDASQTNAVPPPGAVLATRFQSACAPAASSTSPSAAADTR